MVKSDRITASDHKLKLGPTIVFVLKYSSKNLVHLPIYYIYLSNTIRVVYRNHFVRLFSYYSTTRIPPIITIKWILMKHYMMVRHM